MILLFGPVPLMESRETPFSFAMRLARGLTKILSPDEAAGLAACAGALYAGAADGVSGALSCAGAAGAGEEPALDGS